MYNNRKKLLALWIWLMFPFICFAQMNKPLQYDSMLTPYNQQQLLYPALTERFYALTGGRVIWTANNENSRQMRGALIATIDSVNFMGLNPAYYHLQELKSFEGTAINIAGSISANTAEHLFTDAAIALCKDIYQGKNITASIGYDEISKKYDTADNNFIINRLAAVTSPGGLRFLFSSLEPHYSNYSMLRNELAVQIKKNALPAIKQLSLSLNLYRWIFHFRLGTFIVVNIPSALLRCYRNDSLVVEMKVVAGKPATKTPRFAAYCNQVILYPYWNVPASIAFNELLPKVKRNPAVLDAMSMQVVDKSGNVIPPSEINWSRYSKKYFPYRFRQSTGCDNSLGIMKFNITDPYSVYMHDTNNKIAFMSGYRFYSHGCIRLEEPMQLGNLLLDNKLDTSFLQACYKHQEPVIMELKVPAAVFVIYSTADTDVANRIIFYKDVYGLLK